MLPFLLVFVNVPCQLSKIRSAQLKQDFPQRSEKATMMWRPSSPLGLMLPFTDLLTSEGSVNGREVITADLQQSRCGERQLSEPPLTIYIPAVERKSQITNIEAALLLVLLLLLHKKRKKPTADLHLKNRLNRPVKS